MKKCARSIIENRCSFIYIRKHESKVRHITHPIIAAKIVDSLLQQVSHSNYSIFLSVPKHSAEKILLWKYRHWRSIMLHSNDFITGVNTNSVFHEIDSNFGEICMTNKHVHKCATQWKSRTHRPLVIIGSGSEIRVYARAAAKPSNCHRALSHLSWRWPPRQQNDDDAKALCLTHQIYGVDCQWRESNFYEWNCVVCAQSACALIHKHATLAYKPAVFFFWIQKLYLDIDTDVRCFENCN